MSVLVSEECYLSVACGAQALSSC